MQTTTDQMPATAWFEGPIFGGDITGHFSDNVQESDVILTYQACDSKSVPISDTRRSKIGEYLPAMYDMFTSEHAWPRIIRHTVGQHFGQTGSEADILKALRGMDNTSMKKVETFALAILEIWRSNVTPKHRMPSKPLPSKYTVQKGWIHKDIRLGGQSFGLLVNDLVVFPRDPSDAVNDWALRNALHLELEGTNLEEDSKEIQAWPAFASFMSGNGPHGGCMTYRHNHVLPNAAIFSVLLNIQAAILQYEDRIKVGTPRDLESYVDILQANNPSKPPSKWCSLLELRIRHIKFYQSLEGLLEALNLKIPKAHAYTLKKVAEVGVDFPLPSSGRFYAVCRDPGLNAFKSAFKSGSKETASLDLAQMEEFLRLIKELRAPVEDLELQQDNPEGGHQEDRAPAPSRKRQATSDDGNEASSKQRKTDVVAASASTVAHSTSAQGFQSFSTEGDNTDMFSWEDWLNNPPPTDEDIPDFEKLVGGIPGLQEAINQARNELVGAGMTLDSMEPVNDIQAVQPIFQGQSILTTPNDNLPDLEELIGGIPGLQETINQARNELVAASMTLDSMEPNVDTAIIDDCETRAERSI